MSSDVVVIGAGIAGYTTAIALRRAGASVTLVTKGMGGLPLSTGTVDILGRLGGAAGPTGPDGGADLASRMVRRTIDKPLATIAASTTGKDGAAGLLPEDHPYRTIGEAAVREGVEAFARMVGEDLLSPRTDVGGSQDGADGGPAGAENLWLPTAVGAVKASYLIQPSMAASVLRDGGRYLVVGLRRLKDLTPELVAGNLERTELPGGGRVQARAESIDLEARSGEWDTTGLNYARALDRSEVVARLAKALEGKVRDGETVLLPAVLGVERPGVYRELSEMIGAAVGEIPMPPSSVPGIRLDNRLARLASDERVRVVMGAPVVSFTSQGHGHDARVTSVTTAATGHELTHRAGAFVLAAGGFESGALTLTSHGIVRDTVLGLPLAGVGPDGAQNLRRLIHNDYWGKPQGLFRVGVLTDGAMRPLGADGEPVYANVRAVGGVLAGAVRWSEASGEGIALGSAHAAVASLLADGAAHHGAALTQPVGSVPAGAGQSHEMKETI